MKKSTDYDWSVPGAYQVSEGVYRIPLPLPGDGLRAVNTYVIVEDGTVVCVDSGWALPDSRRLFRQALSSLGLGESDIDRFLVTHVHRDHYTQAIAIRTSLATHVSLGRGEQEALEVIAAPDRVPMEPHIGQLRLHGAPKLASEIATLAARRQEDNGIRWEPPDEWLEEGELAIGETRRLRVVETPGHTRGHVVFHDQAAGLLFAGDHVLPTITPSIGFEPVLSPNPLGDYLGSLARVRELPDALLLPAHGGVTSSAHMRIDELVSHHDRRLGETLAALDAGAQTAFEVASLLRWTRRERSIDELDLFNQMLAVSETAAHLKLLVAQGRVMRTLDQSVYIYTV
jgi:glyoxylase-like metal-dependent hydrolase (beta-lactamase superfamily II)